MTDESFLGVRVKLFEDGRVKVLLFKVIDGRLRKYFLDNDGEWIERVVGASEPTGNIRLVYTQRDIL